MRKFLWSFFEIIESITVAVVLVFLVRYFVAQPFLVSGSSMEPNFKNGDYLLVDELAYRFREPERGEVIVFRYPGDPRVYYIKRIIGLPGERVTGDGSNVTVYQNGDEIVLNEPYVWVKESRAKFDVTLGAGEYFVLGDNRNFSFDSRSWGSLPGRDIIGLARFRLWPINKVMAFSAPTY
ncbi:MAG: Signal peptidase I [Candidatus Jorgensenbacteria bacterium GW2011_GWA1_48_13]|uniref:Signal peptidase I n=2 Tax=Candidatus Joergenseniibacteriota TaxID=1752739 RepID=A0A0G1W7R8_9BACT|nr:MAG: Signal peptidase I [Candidatus Jorgensenbacteria bacterium GW2011_GWA1_48_13]KKU99245.1 MAG: Signal peptidase I [Candidatus Jorgensenbacteria bacterium GW2011_GWC1_48_8]KKW14816.1 MAG: Signal peptidase I [Candidatus Jorgensenbacteria bacterium GW2011_GWB1_50_10]